VANGYDDHVVAAYRDRATPASGVFWITHAGSLYGQRDALPLVEALARAVSAGALRRGAVRLRLVGSLIDPDRLRSRLADLDMASDVEILPPVSHENSLEYLAASNALLVVQPGTELQVPVKLFEYMGLRKPILALAPDGAVADIVRRGRLGFAVLPNDVAAIQSALVELCHPKAENRYVFAPDDEFVRGFEGARLSQVLEHLLVAAHRRKRL
jgi:glycosyltransferase involved in cell wall biosynthesis